MKNRTWIQFAGVSGGVFLAFGIVGYILLGGAAETLLNIHLIGGAILIAVFLLFGGIRQLGTTDISDRQSIFRFWLNFVVTILLIGFCLVCVNWLGARYEYRVDLTEARIHSLAPQSVELARSLDSVADFTIFTGIRKQSAIELIRLISLYQKENPDHIRYRVVDPVSRPDLVAALRMKPGEMIAITYGNATAKPTVRLKQADEVEITNALLKLQQGVQREIYYIVGHGEPDLNETGPFGVSALARAIRTEHGRISPLPLASKQSIPTDAAAVLLFSPKSQLSKIESKLLIEYTEKGGNLLILVDPGRQINVSDLLHALGIESGQNVIIDKANRPIGEPQLSAQPLVRDFGAHPIVEGFSTSAMAVFNIASSVRAAANDSAGGRYVPILNTSKTAWGELSVNEVLGSAHARAERDEGDEAGPLSLGMVLHRKEAGGKAGGQSARVIVIGDSDWILNANLGWYKNGDLALNSIGWLSGSEGGVTIRPRAYRNSAVEMSRESYLLLLVASFLAPELVLLFGMFIWVRRRAIATTSTQPAVLT